MDLPLTCLITEGYSLLFSGNLRERLLHGPLPGSAPRLSRAFFLAHCTIKGSSKVRGTWKSPKWPNFWGTCQIHRGFGGIGFSEQPKWVWLNTYMIRTCMDLWEHGQYQVCDSAYITAYLSYSTMSSTHITWLSLFKGHWRDDFRTRAEAVTTSPDELNPTFKAPNMSERSLHHVDLHPTRTGDAARRKTLRKSHSMFAIWFKILPETWIQ